MTPWSSYQDRLTGKALVSRSKRTRERKSPRSKGGLKNEIYLFPSEDPTTVLLKGQEVKFKKQKNLLNKRAHDENCPNKKSTTSTTKTFDNYMNWA